MSKQFESFLKQLLTQIVHKSKLAENSHSSSIRKPKMRLQNSYAERFEQQENWQKVEIIDNNNIIGSGMDNLITEKITAKNN